MWRSQFNCNVCLFPAAVTNLSCIIALLYWRPNPDQLGVFFVFSALWGMADAIWQTQTNCKSKLFLVCRNKWLERSTYLTYFVPTLGPRFPLMLIADWSVVNRPQSEVVGGARGLRWRHFSQCRQKRCNLIYHMRCFTYQQDTLCMSTWNMTVSDNVGIGEASSETSFIVTFKTGQSDFFTASEASW